MYSDVFALLAMLAIIACTDSREESSTLSPQVQKTISDFNGHSYGYSLYYADGKYAVKADKSISSEDIRRAVDGKAWNLEYLGPIRPEGFTEGDMDGFAGATYTFSGETAHLVTYDTGGEPPYPEVESDVNVTYGANALKAVPHEWIVWSVADNTIYCVEITAYDNYWFSCRLVLRD